MYFNFYEIQSIQIFQNSLLKCIWIRNDMNRISPVSVSNRKLNKNILHWNINVQLAIPFANAKNLGFNHSIIIEVFKYMAKFVSQSRWSSKHTHTCTYKNERFIRKSTSLDKEYVDDKQNDEHFSIANEMKWKKIENQKQNICKNIVL